MHNFEEELKGRFKDAASTEGVDPDQLWASILQELPNSPVSPPKKNRRGWLWLSLLFLLLLAGFFFFLFPGNPGQTAEEMDTSMAPPPRAKTSASAPFTEQPTTPSSSLQTGTVLSQTTVEHPSTDDINKGDERSSLQYDKPAAQTITLTPSKNNVPGSQLATTISLQPTMESQIVPIAGLPSPASAAEPSLLNTLTTTRNFSEKTTNEPALVRDVRPLAHLENKKLLLPTTPLHPEFSIPTLATKKASHNRFNLGIFTGLQYWSDTYAQDADLGKTLSDAYSSQPGYSVSLEIGYQLKPHLEIRSGLEYLRAYTQFNLTQSWDTLMFRDNIPGNELINAEATRTVKHLNKQQLLSIPIFLGTHTDRRKWRLGINAGVNFNFLLNQEGKSLNSQEVITSYEQTNGTEAPYNSFFWSAQLQPYAQYQLKNKAAIQLRPSLRWQAHGDSAFLGLRHQSFLSGLSIGLLF